MKIGSLCSGYGGLTLAVQQVLGGEVAWHSEIDEAPSKVLDARFPDVPNLGDMTAIDWETVEPVEVYEGGTPCQDVSHAGGRAGMRDGTRSGLWSAFAMGIGVLRPQLVIWENVRGVASAEADSDVEPCPGCVGDGTGGSPLRALGRVLGDLADLGYDARWCGLPASAVGAPHERFRYFVAAYPADLGHERPWEAWGRRVRSADRGQSAADSDGRGRGRDRAPLNPQSSHTPGRDPVTPNPDSGAVREQPVAVAGGSGPALAGDSVQWGEYEYAIRRWERVLGRPAPVPRRVSDRGALKLSPEFDEWLMGVPAGWISEVPGISWNDMLKLCGNGVVPQQAAAAIRYLLDLP